MGSAWAREEEDYSAFYIPTVFCVFVLLLFPFVVFFSSAEMISIDPSALCRPTLRSEIAILSVDDDL
ncbi:Uncharacterized protein APZ42_017505 [Daphnia magna]|uniref:Uncharacterized protein n=1 Tax=Daphnia magna TaxID=35525 RepID=A0A164ZWN8_9CRUS|nr:Uncharacterized protein APZ42_017505 [Daphnia magna]